MDLWIIRAILFAAILVSGYLVRPFHLDGSFTLALSTALGLLIILVELRVRKCSLKTLIGAAVGSILGITGASLISLVIHRMTLEPATGTFAQVMILLLMAYVGLVCGANKGEYLDLAALGGIFSDRTAKRAYKVLDTSVIIDGRVADICKTGFLEGTLVVPHFVLRELQQIADSADSIKRNRGRRGLDILEKVKGAPGITVQIVEKDYPDVREVDLKLIELAKELGAKIVTNDFNLNKVSQLRGVEVLNINELANALKPVVLPGVIIRLGADIYFHDLHSANGSYHGVVTTEHDVYQALRGVVDPELGDDIVELGMVTDVEITDGVVSVGVALTIAQCPMRGQIEQDTAREGDGAPRGT